MTFLDEWKADIPSVEKTTALILLIINCILPGIGTLVLCCVAEKFSTTQLIVGLLQIVTVPLLFLGWIWSIWWGLLILEKSHS
jgi:hypothetical protein